MTDPADVEIVADGLLLAGHLRVPAGRQPRAALVFTGPFTGVKEQVVGEYASRLSEAGFVTLVFDHRNFGASEGHIRQHEDSAGRLADLRAATSMLAAHEAVDAPGSGRHGRLAGGRCEQSARMPGALLTTVPYIQHRRRNRPRIPWN